MSAGGEGSDRRCIHCKRSPQRHPNDGCMGYEAPPRESEVKPGRMQDVLRKTAHALGRWPDIAVLPHDRGPGYTVFDRTTPWCTHGGGLKLSAAVDLAKRRPWKD